ncbi:hypothetical protein, partial [Caulobacter sp. HMWF009]
MFPLRGKTVAKRPAGGKCLTYPPSFPPLWRE